MPKVGSETDGRTVGPHGTGERNECSEKWVQWCDSKNMVIMNTWFKEHPRRLYTWKSPGDHSGNQIDYIAINSQFKRGIKGVKTYPGADCGSDHVPVVAKFQCKPKKVKKARNVQKLVFEQLHMPEMHLEYSVQVKNQFESLIDEGEETTWEAMRDILIETAENILPKEKKRKRQKWMTEEILLMMEDRQKLSDRQGSGYRELDKQIKKKCREAKENWLNDQCAEVEEQFGNNHRVYKRINEISGRKPGCIGSGCIKAKEGTMLVEKDAILNRWTEYVEELFHDVRGSMPSFPDLIEGPNILKSEVRTAIKMMRKNKAAGPDGVVIEMIEALEEYGVEKLTEIINKIYDDGKFPEDLSKSIFITLPKKPGAVNCEQHHTISLMSHVTKIILRVLLLRLRSRI